MASALRLAFDPPVTDPFEGGDLTVLRHEGYALMVARDPENNLYCGRVAGMGGPIGYFAASIEDMRLAFERAVGDYVQACIAVGEEPLRFTAP